MKITLRAARREKEISQKRMAQLIFVSMNTYIAMEKNPSKISIDRQTRILQVLKKKPDEIDWAQTND